MARPRGLLAYILPVILTVLCGLCLPGLARAERVALIIGNSEYASHPLINAVNDAAGMAERCTIQLSYAIGVSKPLSIYADTHGTGDVDAAAIELAIPKVMDLTPRGIRMHLELNKPIYERTAAYGHFGRAPEADGGFSWERTDLVDALKTSV